MKDSDQLGKKWDVTTLMSLFNIKFVFKAAIVLIFRALSEHLGVLNLRLVGLVLLLILINCRQMQLVNNW